jgi:multiple sugar transport system ATP-binding protein
MAGIVVRGLSKSFGPVQALRRIDLVVGPGELAVLLGPSGCGKSTLLNAIAGLDDVDTGTVEIGGLVVTHREPSERGIAMVFQSYAPYPTMTARRNLSFGLRVRRVPRAEIEQRVAWVSELLQIGGLLDRKPSQLSGGQRQRVAIGRALVQQAQVFLFDEPLSNLDAKLRSEMRVELKRLHQRPGTTIIYVTHDQIEAMTLATRIAVMRAGKIVLGIRPEHVSLADPGAPGPVIEAETLFIEPMGVDTLGWFQYGSQRISARLPPQRARRLSGKLHLALDISQVSLFDPTTEQRL